MGGQIYRIGQNDRYFAETKVVENSSYSKKKISKVTLKPTRASNLKSIDLMYKVHLHYVLP